MTHAARGGTGALVQASPFLAGVGASFLAGTVATTLGALPVVVVGRLDERTINVLLSFAAGVSSEVIPETHRPGFERGATVSLFVGFSAMLFLSFVWG